MIVSGRISGFKITTDTQNLALKSELWGVCCKDIGENWPCYSGTAVYICICMNIEITWQELSSLMLWYKYTDCLWYPQNNVIWHFSISEIFIVQQTMDWPMKCIVAKLFVNKTNDAFSSLDLVHHSFGRVVWYFAWDNKGWIIIFTKCLYLI